MCRYTSTPVFLDTNIFLRAPFSLAKYAQFSYAKGMPSRNSEKMYVTDGYYHVYNRGVDKRAIFLDQQDYTVFLGFLENYLMPKEKETLEAQLSEPGISGIDKQKILKQLRINNFHEEITMLTYCLMPNHFHFFIKQKSKTALDTFMNSLLTRYVMYFNKKYDRQGRLFQGVYKAVLVEEEPYFLHLSAYIHRNPLSLSKGKYVITGQPSSYLDYLGNQTTEWVKPEEILSYFSKTNPTLSYQEFVKQSTNFSLIADTTIDEKDDIAMETSAGGPLKDSGFMKGWFGR